MNPDPGTFEELRRLLVLKRYEQPPPGYFDRFPSEVIARIRESESASNLAILQPPVPWLQQLWNALEARVVLPTAFGAAVCSVLILGLMRSSVLQASSVHIAERLDGTPYSADTRPMGMQVVERIAPESSTAGILPDQPAAGMFRRLHGPLNPGNASPYLLLYPLAN
jgi:hypothetical protein